MSMNYSIELLSLISTMLSTERDSRPTASQAKGQLRAIALQLFQPKTTNKCSVCEEVFSSRTQLDKHYKKFRHYRPTKATSTAPPVGQGTVKAEDDFSIRGCATVPPQYYYDEAELEAVDPSPCVVCNKYFNTKGQFFSHLGGGRHWRNAKYVQKRKAEIDLNVDVGKGERRHEKWTRKDMQKHD
ncbi:hypothetical protein BDU57DRAFT_201128 [Ampelomyces quisqualis]|uniref:C2H2-type domain-containing protein n=1 Tax=Ampelomyces quisqualis TaxID=50730 RepID=A0A6A5QSV0_AMPQU|nr:hypothetical protein BDU57DRAFT_201128 [Ampelomyces quisqualis]